LGAGQLAPLSKVLQPGFMIHQVDSLLLFLIVSLLPGLISFLAFEACKPLAKPWDS